MGHLYRAIYFYYEGIIIKKLPKKCRVRMKFFNEQDRMSRKINKRRKKFSSSKKSRIEVDFIYSEQASRDFNERIDGYNQSKSVSIDQKLRATVHLPSRMNFSDAFEQTARVILIIRQFTENYALTRRNKKAYKLSYINFEGLEKISTSAGLVLAATLSGWNDKIAGSMKAIHENWNDTIKTQLVQLGFFELFGLTPPDIVVGNSRIKSIKYIRGTSATDDKKIFELKDGLQNILAVDLKKEKWLYLAAGITEAITNVIQHAYPDKGKTDKLWFMTGGFDTVTGELKIVFYDQGIGIPNSLPRTLGMEKLKKLLAQISRQDDDASRIHAAVEMGRTRTNKAGRGKGVSDMLDFIKQRAAGYISIMSQKGLYKYTKGAKKAVKQDSLIHPISGTLIIWSVKLER